MIESVKAPWEPRSFTELGDPESRNEITIGVHVLTASLIGTLRCLQASRTVLVVSVMLASFQLLAEGKERPMEHPTFYRTIKIDGLSIFYRETGPNDAPTLLLLHGLPSSSRMFEPLFARLSDQYPLLAPDYPGFGHGAWPYPNPFVYPFDPFADII